MNTIYDNYSVFTMGVFYCSFEGYLLFRNRRGETKNIDYKYITL